MKDVLKSTRAGVDSFHDLVYKEALELASSVNVNELIPRFASRQQHRQNTPAASPEEYYKRVLTIPILDFLVTELDIRFNHTSSHNIVEFMLLLPSQLSTCTTVVTKRQLSNILDMYADDFPSVMSFDAELKLWHRKWEKENDLAKKLNNPEKVLIHTDKDYFPHIYTLFHIMATLPVTSCECERSISMLKLTKSSLRSTTTEDRLNGLLMVQCHRDISLDADEVVTKYAHSQPRRMEL